MGSAGWPCLSVLGNALNWADLPPSLYFSTCRGCSPAGSWQSGSRVRAHAGSDLLCDLSPFCSSGTWLTRWGDRLPPPQAARGVGYSHRLTQARAQGQPLLTLAWSHCPLPAGAVSAPAALQPEAPRPQPVSPGSGSPSLVFSTHPPHAHTQSASVLPGAPPGAEPQPLRVQCTSACPPALAWLPGAPSLLYSCHSARGAPGPGLVGGSADTGRLGLREPQRGLRPVGQSGSWS